MSDTMLHGVLCMPPELWQDSELDRTQRYQRYLQASQRIEDDEREIEQLRRRIAKAIHWAEHAMLMRSSQNKELIGILRGEDVTPNKY